MSYGSRLSLIVLAALIALAVTHWANVVLVAYLGPSYVLDVARPVLAPLSVLEAFLVFCWLGRRGGVL